MRILSLVGIAIALTSVYIGTVAGANNFFPDTQLNQSFRSEVVADVTSSGNLDKILQSHMAQQGRKVSLLSSIEGDVFGATEWYCAASPSPPECEHYNQMLSDLNAQKESNLATYRPWGLGGLLGLIAGAALYMRGLHMSLVTKAQTADN